MDICPLCAADKIAPSIQVDGKRYFTCSTCSMIFLDPSQRLSREDEYSRYLEHNNSPDDPNYRTFLLPLVEALLPKLPPNARGLDFGSGPGPTTSVMFGERGFEVINYDPFFSPDPEQLNRTYDFVSCSETLEHLFDPRKELKLLNSLLKPGGWLGIRTQFFDDPQTFSGSRYIRDPTHVCFYSTQTFRKIQTMFPWIVEFPGKNLALFQKERLS